MKATEAKISVSFLEQPVCIKAGRIQGNRLRLGIGICLIAFLLVLQSCTEVFTPDLDQGSEILYIEGGITDGQGPHSIRLRYTSGYNDKPDFRAASGASVILLEDGQETCRLSETTEGQYSTDSLFTAYPGKVYKLMIETPDGNIFESTPQTLPTFNQPVDSVYGYPEIRKIKYYNVYGELIILEEEVNQVYADISSTSENSYYRFECQLILEHASGIVVRPGSSDPEIIPLYLWDSFYPDDLSIIEVNAQRESLHKFPLTHTKEDNEGYSRLKDNYFPAIEAEYDERIAGIVQVEVETDSGIYLMDSVIYGIPIEMNDADYYFGWILKIDQYSLTREAYTFWTDIQKLEETEGEIFDPIATQLRGNMRCISNDEILMLGLFEVASKITTPAFVNYIPANGYYPGRRVNITHTFPDNGWNDTIPPDFWIEKIFTAGNGMKTDAENWE